VEKGQPLFTVMQQSPQDPDGGGIVAIVAQRAGVIYDVKASVDSFVQASQILGRIVDVSPAGLYVAATLAIRPEDVRGVVPGSRATVRTQFLGDGRALPATVASVGFYDADKGTIDVKLRLNDPVSEREAMAAIGLPVEVSLTADGGAAE
jgi:multidrug efflux pump subunit AcrA (membrane-fusion protein)